MIESFLLLLPPKISVNRILIRITPWWISLNLMIKYEKLLLGVIRYKNSNDFGDLRIIKCKISFYSYESAIVGSTIPCLFYEPTCCNRRFYFLFLISLTWKKERENMMKAMISSQGMLSSLSSSFKRKLKGKGN